MMGKIIVIFCFGIVLINWNGVNNLLLVFILFIKFIECFSICFLSLVNINYLYDIWDLSVLCELIVVLRLFGVEGGLKVG